jgi:hypothetical protein
VRVVVQDLVMMVTEQVVLEAEETVVTSMAHWQ